MVTGHAPAIELIMSHWREIWSAVQYIRNVRNSLRNASRDAMASIFTRPMFARRFISHSFLVKETLNFILKAIQILSLYLLPVNSLELWNP